MARRYFNRTLAVLALMLLSQVANADELTERARQLIDQRKAVEAFQLLEPAEGARAGEPAFDLLFGIAAIDAGQNTRGVFALERVLAVEPNNARARAEIARAYFALGETKTARQEFETVQKQGVPPEVSATIDRYLAAVDRLESGGPRSARQCLPDDGAWLCGASRTTVHGYLEAALGYDTNVNVAPNKSSVAIPGFGGLTFTLGPDSQANEDWFSTLGGGFTVRHQSIANWRWSAALPACCATISARTSSTT